MHACTVMSCIWLLHKVRSMGWLTFNWLPHKDGNLQAGANGYPEPCAHRKSARQSRGLSGMKCKGTCKQALKLVRVCSCVCEGKLRALKVPGYSEQQLPHFLYSCKGWMANCTRTCLCPPLYSHLHNGCFPYEGPLMRAQTIVINL